MSGFEIIMNMDHLYGAIPKIAGPDFLRKCDMTNVAYCWDGQVRWHADNILVTIFIKQYQRSVGHHAMDPR